MTSDIRHYKGKYRVEIVLKSKGNWRVRALEELPTANHLKLNCGMSQVDYPIKRKILKGQEFTTVPRLLWRHPRK